MIIEEGEIEAVELESRVIAEKEAEEIVPSEDKIAELSDLPQVGSESSTEVKEGIEEGKEVEASGVTAKEEMAESVSEEAREAA